MFHDPARGEKRLAWNEVANHFTGVALELSPATGFERKDERSRLSLSTFLRQARGARHALLQLLALSLALEILVIAGPFYLQVTVDEVIARGDVDLLLVLALGFALVGTLTVRRNLASVAHCHHHREHAPLRLWSTTFSPPDSPSPLLLREAAHRRCAVPLHLYRAGAKRRQRRPYSRAHRWHYGGDSPLP